MFTDKEYRGPFEFSEVLANLSVGAKSADNVMPAQRVEASDNDLLLSTSEKEESRGPSNNSSAYGAPAYDIASQMQSELAVSKLKSAGTEPLTQTPTHLLHRARTCSTGKSCICKRSGTRSSFTSSSKASCCVKGLASGGFFPGEHAAISEQFAADSFSCVSWLVLGGMGLVFSIHVWLVLFGHFVAICPNLLQVLQEAGVQGYSARMAEKVTIVYPMRFSDSIDTVLATSFLQEFVEARRTVGLNNAPPCFWSPSPPPELEGAPSQALTANAGFVTFVIFPHHVEGRKLDRTVWSLSTFHAYISYHVKGLQKVI